jgi:hypothetical protein
MANEYRVSQFTAEVLRDGAPEARVSSFTAEVLRDGPAEARVSSFSVEVLRSISDAVIADRRRQMAVPCG